MARDRAAESPAGAGERAKWVRVCHQRAEMWRRTADKAPSGPLHDEARARANEAEFIADLIAAGEADLGVVH